MYERFDQPHREAMKPKAKRGGTAGGPVSRRYAVVPASSVAAGMSSSSNGAPAGNDHETCAPSDAKLAGKRFVLPEPVVVLTTASTAYPSVEK